MYNFIKYEQLKCISWWYENNKLKDRHFYIACKYGSINMIKWFENKFNDHKFNASQKDEECRMNLHRYYMFNSVGRGGNIDVLTYLLKDGDNKKSFNSIYKGCAECASENGKVNILKFLFDRDMINVGKSLEYAVKNGHLNCVKYLVEHDSLQAYDATRWFKSLNELFEKYEDEHPHLMRWYDNHFYESLNIGKKYSKSRLHRLYSPYIEYKGKYD